MRVVTWLVEGSMRATEPLSGSETQTAPLPYAATVAFVATWTVAITLSVVGSIRARSPGEPLVSSAIHTLPSPIAIWLSPGQQRPCSAVSVILLFAALIRAIPRSPEPPHCGTHTDPKPMPIVPQGPDTLWITAAIWL